MLVGFSFDFKHVNCTLTHTHTPLECCKLGTCVTLLMKLDIVIVIFWPISGKGYAYTNVSLAFNSFSKDPRRDV